MLPWPKNRGAHRTVRKLHRCIPSGDARPDTNTILAKCCISTLRCKWLLSLACETGVTCPGASASRRLHAPSGRIFSFFLFCCSCGTMKGCLFIYFSPPPCNILSQWQPAEKKPLPSSPCLALPFPSSWVFFFFCIIKRFSSHPPFARFCL